MRLNNSAIVDIFKNIQNIKDFEITLSSKSCRKILRRILSGCTARADMVGLSRWAITDRTGRQMFCFKRKNSSLNDDLESELISAIWYNIFLEERQQYLIERLWTYMAQTSTTCKDPIRMHFIFTFNNRVEGEKSGNQSDINIKKIDIGEKLIEELDKKAKIHNKLCKESDEILKRLKKNNIHSLTNEELIYGFKRNSYVMNVVRKLCMSKKIMASQQAGIKRGISLLASDSNLQKCFKLLYEKEIGAEKKRLRLSDNESREQCLYYYELATKFLFMWQNIAILCPAVQVIHLFTYISVNRKQRSSICLFFKTDAHSVVLPCEKIFNILNDIESATPRDEGQQQWDGKKYWRWTKTLDKLIAEQIRRKLTDVRKDIEE